MFPGIENENATEHDLADCIINVEAFPAFFCSLSEKTLPDIRSGNEIFSAGPKRFSSVMSDGPTGFGFHCVAYDVAIDVAKCALLGKVMQLSPCPEVRTLTNGNGHYIMKLNDLVFNMFRLYFK